MDAISTGLHGRSPHLSSSRLSSPCNNQLDRTFRKSRTSLKVPRLHELCISVIVPEAWILQQTCPIFFPSHLRSNGQGVPTSCHNCQVTRATDGSRKRFSSTFAMTCAQLVKRGQLEYKTFLSKNPQWSRTHHTYTVQETSRRLLQGLSSERSTPNSTCI